MNERSSIVREELSCSVVANSLNPKSPMELVDRSRVVREEMCCSAVAKSLAHESQMKLDLSSRVMRDALCCSAAANALAPESRIEFDPLYGAPDRSSLVRKELRCSAVANALASEAPMLLHLRSRVMREGSFERSRERDCSSLEEEEEEAIWLLQEGAVIEIHFFKKGTKRSRNSFGLEQPTQFLFQQSFRKQKE